MGHCNCSHCHSEPKSKISPYLLPAISFLMLLGGIAMQVAEAGFFNQTIRFIWYALAYLPVGLPVMKEAVESIREKDISSVRCWMSVLKRQPSYAITNISGQLPPMSPRERSSR